MGTPHNPDFGLCGDFCWTVHSLETRNSKLPRPVITRERSDRGICFYSKLETRNSKLLPPPLPSARAASSAATKSALPHRTAATAPATTHSRSASPQTAASTFRIPRRHTPPSPTQPVPIATPYTPAPAPPRSPRRCAPPRAATPPAPRFLRLLPQGQTPPAQPPQTPPATPEPPTAPAAWHVLQPCARPPRNTAPPRCLPPKRSTRERLAHYPPARSSRTPAWETPRLLRPETRMHVIPG